MCLRTFSVEMTSFCDDQAYSKTLNVLARHEPSHVLVTPAFEDTVTHKIITTEFPDATICLVARRAWNESKGLQCLRHYSHRNTLAELEPLVNSKYLTLSALAALVEAVESSEKTSFVKVRAPLACCVRPRAVRQAASAASGHARWRITAARAFARARRARSRSSSLRRRV
jgi:hypothetical protein